MGIICHQLITCYIMFSGALLLLACVILVGLFALQHCGTHRVAFLFAPIVVIWLVAIFSIGLYNTIRWNPKIVKAFSPLYIIKFFSQTGKDGWIALGGILLSITGMLNLALDRILLLNNGSHRSLTLSCCYVFMNLVFIFVLFIYLFIFHLGLNLKA